MYKSLKTEGKENKKERKEDIYAESQSLGFNKAQYHHIRKKKLFHSNIITNVSNSVKLWSYLNLRYMLSATVTSKLCMFPYLIQRGYFWVSQNLQCCPEVCVWVALLECKSYS